MKRHLQNKSSTHPNYSTLAKILIPLMSSAAIIGCNDSSSETSTTTPSGSFVTLNDNQAAIYLKLDPTINAQSANSSDLYDGYTLHIWNNENCNSFAGADTDWNAGQQPDGIDDTYGAYWLVNLKDDPSQCVNFIPHKGSEKPLGDVDGKLDLTQAHQEGNYVFTKQGSATVYPELPDSLAPNTTRLYLNLADNNYADMTLHVWNNDKCANFDGKDTDWGAGLPITGTSKTYGAYWDIAVNNDASQCVNVIPHRGDEKPLINDTKIELDKAATNDYLAFTFGGNPTVYYKPLASAPSNIELKGASAHWISKDVLAMKPGAQKVELLFSASGKLNYDATTKTFTGVDTTVATTQGGDDGWKTHYRHLNGLEGWQLNLADLDPKTLLKGQLYAVAYDAGNNVSELTQVQIAGALDSYYTTSNNDGNDQQYGAIINGSNTTFRLWAPTAQTVELIPYSKNKIAGTAIAMDYDAASGAWSTTTDALTHGDYFRYKISVYHPAVNEFRSYEVTDPYSLSLSVNSEFSQVVNLDAPELKPAGWDSLNAPINQANPAEFVIYEAQVRDFSGLDDSTSPELRGKYGAFGQADSKPVQHLKSLTDNGVTHLHLLPVFDIATINEDTGQVANINEPFTKLCQVNAAVKESEFAAHCNTDKTISAVFNELLPSDSPQNPVIQKLNSYVRGVDAFNWGYDPLHYTVPEGSYATNPEGVARILQFREMVASVKKDIGMNVVMDVVYNHTNAAGPDSKYSVLDKIVPWYYQRLNAETGAVETSTCCSNTAPENAMMAKLVKDSLVIWAKDYKIDSFRFDLMGHHPKDQIMESLAAVKTVDPDTYFYGEGWNFGEVANNQRFDQAIQANMAGTGVGTFSDRLRDAVRGGGPFDGAETLRSNQGFGNGAAVLPNETNGTSKETALHLADLTRLGLTGNLKDFVLIDSKGQTKKGSQVDYNGQGAGYANDPTEIQNYVSKHDNQTLWDNNQYKIPYSTPAETRTRMQAVSLATALLGQGVPFTHMGSELLRSKSMQRDSYDSGDWYNLVDFTKQDNNWDRGLPREDKDGSNWAVIDAVIKNAAENAKPQPEHIEMMSNFYKELTSLRKSSSLITLGTGEKVMERVDFHNTGADQQAGLIVMSIDDGTSTSQDLDSTRDALVIIINATDKAVNFNKLSAEGFTLHSIHTAKGQASLAYGAKVENNAFVIPVWSAVVFEQLQGSTRGKGVPVSQK
ncbi:pullulanase-type alpha-1,6-glucosidase [Vibrio sp. Of7-15]|uniref:pullulanase-type alpha-1,6-glucosidase n=1 Tax=Vibrio sp. Of7-15 TaxID=2724879 RepID=UPI0031BA37D9